MRVLVLSLCLTGAAGAATITPFDGWSSLRQAPLVMPSLLDNPEPQDFRVPALSSDLNGLLQFVLDWAHPGLDDPDEYSAVVSVLLPQYERLLRGFATVPAASSLVQTTPIGGNASVGINAVADLASVLEPTTWALVLGSMGVLALCCRRRG